MKSTQTILRPVPVVAVRDSVVFPHGDSLLSFGRPKSILAINAAFTGDRVVAIFTQKSSKVTDPSFADLYRVGTIATVTQVMTTEGEVHAMVRGQARIEIKEEIATSPYLEATVAELKEENEITDQIQALARQLVDLFKKAINLGKPVEVTTVMKVFSGQSEIVESVDSIASLLEVKTKEKQELLEETSLFPRLQKVVDLLSREVGVMELERTLSIKTQKKFEDQMRKSLLTEKKRVIEEELGEEDEGGSETAEYSRKIKAAKMPKEVLVKAKKELKRLSQMSSHNPEIGYIKNYLDWLTDMPWSVASPNNVSLSNAAKILNEEHHGLEKTKERILEYLAVMRLRKNGKAKRKGSEDEGYKPTILCFMGPPGVGKTSIGRSIAHALGRKFVRVSLGGIRDEAEIRGHRRTYVGALPGRIIQGIKNAGTKNPVFMLDEIDKLGTDFRGDPSSALLEALDPEQNKEFSDHYLEVPFDVSQVMFITTGNVLENIPYALRDRMEVIEFPGYTQDDKYLIARDFLWDKQIKNHGLEKYRIKISKGAIGEIIDRYTREAGVRNLDRNLATALRKIARLVAEKKKYPREIGRSDVRKFLGPQKFSSLSAEKKDEVGVATGLSVTAAGGEILFIEVSVMPGKGNLILTGQLGSVMKESAKAAFTWTRAHWQELGLKQDFGGKIDVHIHVPEGAVPKDGPSAGTSIATALVSALTGIPVKKSVGMTGEITLRGHVTEIGGVKEKVIAGHRAGLSTIILPKDNKKDMEEVPASVKRDVKFVFVDQLESVLSQALAFMPKTVNTKKKRFPYTHLYATA